MVDISPEMLQKYLEGRKVKINKQIYGKLMDVRKDENMLKIILKGGMEFPLGKEDILEVYHNRDWYPIYDFLQYMKREGY